MPETVSPDPRSTDQVQIEVDGRQEQVGADQTLLGALRDDLGLRSAKDGCSPQGQCGCCTVLVDGAPRVACVTPVRRIAGRSVTTLDGLEPVLRQRWTEAFLATGASQCGFCTPGIIMRLAGLEAKGPAAVDPVAVDRALAAHLCRCTGWQTIVEAWQVGTGPTAGSGPLSARNMAEAARRAFIEGHVPQAVSTEVALGRGGFADDSAPADALVAVPDGDGGWAVGETLAEARVVAGKRQGRRTTIEPSPPLDLPPGDWAVTLRTSWVEPAYLETDASWCRPGEDPTSALGNGGAFGGKLGSSAPRAARRLADLHGRPVRVLLSREDTVRMGPKRPPISAGVHADGSGVIRSVPTPGLNDLLKAVAPQLALEEVPGRWLPTSLALRGSLRTEVAMLRAGLAGHAQPVQGLGGSVAEAEVNAEGIRVRVACGDPLDAVVLRSYCIGAAHMALSWVTSEGLAVDADGTVLDLTVRSFGVLRSADTPPIEIEIDTTSSAGAGEPVNGSDAVFAAVAAAVWIDQGCPQDLPTGHRPKASPT